jgi:hypothetical protein
LEEFLAAHEGGNVSLMRRNGIVIIAVVFSLAIAVLICAKVPTLKRTTFGHLARMILGSPGAQQWIDDLVDDIHTLNRSEDLLRWSDSLIRQFQRGSIPIEYINKDPGDKIRMIGFVSEQTIHVPDEQIPQWLKGLWSEGMFGMPPTVIIKLAEDGRPQYVVYGWYLKGVAIGVTDPKDLDFGPWQSKLAAPGIYAYAMEK